MVGVEGAVLVNAGVEVSGSQTSPVYETVTVFVGVMDGTPIVVVPVPSVTVEERK